MRGLLHAARAFPRSELVQSAALAALGEMVSSQPSPPQDGRCDAVVIGASKAHFISERRDAASAVAFRAADDGLELIAAAAARFPAAVALQRKAFVVACAVLDGLKQQQRDSATDRLAKAGLLGTAVTAICELVQPAAAASAAVHSDRAALPGEPFCLGGAWSTVRQALLIDAMQFLMAADFLRRACAGPAMVTALVCALRFEVAFWLAHLATSASGAFSASEGRLPNGAGLVAASIMCTLSGLITHPPGPHTKTLERAFVRAGGHFEVLATIDGLMSADASLTELAALQSALELFEYSLSRSGVGALAQPAAVLAEGRRLTARVVLMLQPRALSACADTASGDDSCGQDRLEALDAALSALSALPAVTTANRPKSAGPLLHDESLAFRAAASCCASSTCLVYRDVLYNVSSLFDQIECAHASARAPAVTVRCVEEAVRMGFTDAAPLQGAASDNLTFCRLLLLYHVPSFSDCATPVALL